MTRDKIEKVRSEMERLNKRIDCYLANKAKDEQKGKPVSLYPKETGAIKRASLDLTRSLADLRWRPRKVKK